VCGGLLGCASAVPRTRTVRSMSMYAATCYTFHAVPYARPYVDMDMWNTVQCRLHTERGSTLRGRMSVCKWIIQH
jgi:hypothetical protein